MKNFLIILLLTGLGFAQSVQFGGNVASTGQLSASSGAAPAPPPPFSVTTSALPSAQANSAYIPFTILTQNGVGAVTCGTITGMPTGMTINSSCVVGGSSSVAGNFPVTGIATDSKTPTAQTAAFSFMLSITCPPLSIISPLTLPNGTQNQLYGPHQLLALGGILPLNWTQPSGTLPTGVTVSSGGSIAGTPTNAGTFAPGIQVTDSCPVPQTTPVSTFALTVVANTAPLGFVTTTIPAATVESAYSSKIQVKGGTPPYTLSQTVGSLFLPMDSTGVVSGTVEDIMDWISIDSRRTGQHLTGTGNPHYSYIDTDGTKFWSQKGSGGNPWDIFPYGTTGQANACPNDVNGAPMFCHWITENGDENAFSNARAYKRLVTPIALTHRYFDGNTTESNTTAGPNPLKRTLNCELDGEPTINLGQTMGAREAIVTTPWGGAVGTQRTLVLDWHYTFSGGVYQNREQFYYVRGWGLVQWQNEQWNGSTYVPSQTVTDTTLTAGGAPTPNFPCYGTTPGWIGGAPGAGGNDTAFKAATPAMSATATVQVSDSLAATASQSFTLNVDPLAFADNRNCPKGDIPNFGAGGVDGPAALPIACMNTALANTPSPGATVTATANSLSSVQALWNAAACGDTVLIPVGTYPGQLLAPIKSCDAAHWVTLKTAQIGSLPPEGTRISPAWTGIPSLHVACPAPSTNTECGRPPYNQPAIPGVYMPKFISTNQTAFTNAGTASFVRIIGIEFTSAAGNTPFINVIDLSGVDHFILDRVVARGGNSPNWQSRDNISHSISVGNSTNVAVVDSYVGEAHGVQGAGPIDTQAISLGGVGTTASGPYKIVNNYLEAAGECFFTGGGGAGFAAVTLPATDIEFRRNHCFKPLFWFPKEPSFFGTSFAVKNNGEMKNALRFLIEGNIFENVWVGTADQFGSQLIFEAKNQSKFQTGSATVSGNTLTAVSGTFPADSTDSHCAVAGHCYIYLNGGTYNVQTWIDATHVTVTPTPPPTTSNLSFKAFSPGRNPNAVVSDVVIRYNRLRHSARGFAYATVGSDGGDIGLGTRRIYEHDNIVDDIDGNKWDITGGSCCYWSAGHQLTNSSNPAPNQLRDIWIVHNTVLPSLSGGSAGGGPNFAFGAQKLAGADEVNLTIKDNIGAGGIVDKLGTSALTYLTNWAPGTFCVAGNVFAHTTATSGSVTKTADNPPYPAAGQSPGCVASIGNFNPATYDAIGFVSLGGANGGDYHLQLTSPYHNAASDGTDPGANIDRVNLETAGVN